MRTILASVLALSLAACSTTIDNNTNPVASLFNALPQPLKDQATKDLTDTEFNLTQATAIGVLPQGNAALGCAQQVNQAFGIDPTPGAAPVQSFDAKVDGVASFGSVAYLDFNKLQALQQNGIQISQACVDLIGEIQLRGLGSILNIKVPIVIVPTPAPMAHPVPALTK